MSNPMLFEKKEDAEFVAKDMLNHVVIAYDPTLSCDYACLRCGCRGKCPTYEVVPIGSPKIPKPPQYSEMPEGWF